MKTYRAALIGCSRMGAFIDNEVDHGRAYSHAAGYEVCERTELVACSDLREDVMAQAGERYGVSKEGQYTDYRALIDEEQPEIVSVATQPEHRADIVVYAAEHGARAIYAEKAMAASMAGADAMVEACERNGVFFNMGTNRRWDRGYDAMKEVIDGGRIGKLKSLVIHQTGSLFNTASHCLDLLMRLNSDHPASWVRAYLTGGADEIEGDVLKADPVGQGTIQFENGVTAYALNSGRGLEVEAIGDAGVVTGLQNGEDWQVREVGSKDHRGRNVLAFGEFPKVERTSSTVHLIEDLVHALDTGEPTRCGVKLAHANQELIFAFVESHQRGGARVDLPLMDCPYRLDRNSAPRQPKFERN
ncbi:MAG: Gfo/Idh/MocA family oxidoreductase [Candidatus Latescibacteria bacterium]|nr:Gfo/Idh/MocA family oxidoreductase [Candidatus Latescibacterota bacterium]